tara:strand:- start:2072 stop:2206 length:135 start_codon:yes stop_codon:yes gene_type:complete
LCSTKSAKKGNRLTVEITPFGKEGCEKIALEFMNYALALKQELG